MAAAALAAAAAAAAAYSGPVVDTHTHFTNLSRFQYNCLPPGAASCVNRTYPPWTHSSHTPADYIADSAGTALPTSRIVFMQASVVAEDAEQEAAWVQSMADGLAPQIAAIVAFAPLEDGASVGASLDRLAQYRLFRGVRRILHDRDSDHCWFLTDAFVAGLAELAARGQHFELLATGYGGFDCAVELVRRAPANLTVVMQHCGGADLTAPVGSDKWAQWRKYVHALAAFPNVVAKVSGVPERTTADGMGSDPAWDSWTEAQVQPYIAEVISAFGWRRSFFGGNWFVVTRFSTYARWARALAGIVAGLGASAAEQAGFFNDNAARVYRLP